MLSNEAYSAAVTKLRLEVLNGVSHESLTNTAYDILVSDLVGYGNTLSSNHATALYETVGTLTKYAQGKTSGRIAVALPTGMGKTSAIVAWITALHQLGLDHVSVAVSASKVEALCSIKAALIDHGVPESKIGLKHSVGAKASMESTGDADRPYMLVTHQRVRTSVEHRLFTQHKGKPREVMVYDESLFKSASTHVSEWEILKALSWLKADARGSTKYSSLLAYLDDCYGIIVSALEAIKASPDTTEKVIHLPEKAPVELKGYLDLLGSRMVLEALRTLVEVSQNPLRLALTSQQDNGVLQYQIAVPEDLKNVLILDASYPVRALVKMDSTIKDGLMYSRGLELKRFDNVTIHQQFSHSGRNTISKSMQEQRRDKRKVSQAVAEVIKDIPAEESILVFTFKKRANDPVDILSILKDDLRGAGVDIGAETKGGKLRINFLTWGDETSLNTMSHCQNVILAGVMQRSHLDIASAIVGQQDDLNADIGNGEILDAINSEIDHLVYQALSRGSCREMDNGQAKPMAAWIMHRDIKLRDRLAQVLPGATWKAWGQADGGVSGGAVAAPLAHSIMEHLDGLPLDVTKLSTKKLKEDMSLATTSASTFTRAVDMIHDSPSSPWMKEGRSLVRNQTKQEAQ